MAAPSGALKRTPLAVTVEGAAVVLFRNRQGQASALSDRCPHRGLPLSMGHCSHGRLVCRYHGWEFDHEGVCQRIPADPTATRPRAMLTPYAICEQDGYVWISPGGAPPSPPDGLPLAGRRWWQTRVTMPHPFLAVASQLAVIAADIGPNGGCRWVEALPDGKRAQVMAWPIPAGTGQTRVEVMVERLGVWPFPAGQTVYRPDLALPLGLQALQVVDTYAGATESP
jgi:nitrite reductase/ring-hydroxylating ferredoxin subunit